MAAIEEGEELQSTDEAILEELRDQRLEYVALVANRRGLNLSYTRERCRVLDRRGLIERTTDEVTYRLTSKGENYLEGVAERNDASVPGPASIHD